MKNNRKTAAFVTALAMIITAANINGGRTIEAKDEIIYGDLNSDGKVDITDLSLLSLHLIGDKPLETDELKEAADVQYDKTIDLGDLACLRQFLSKKTDTIGKITKPADSTETTGSADSSELKDITDQCTFLEIDDYWGECFIYGKFAKDYAEEYTTMISTKEDYDKYIGCFEKAVNALKKQE